MKKIKTMILLTLFFSGCNSNTDQFFTTDSDTGKSISDTFSDSTSGSDSEAIVDFETVTDSDNYPDIEPVSDSETTPDSELNIDEDSLVDEDTVPDEDIVIEPECYIDADCLNFSRGCIAGICRDKCIIFINPCEWKPSGDICSGGYCLECTKDNDCPGIRYFCDQQTFTCQDKPFNPNITKLGMFYHTWHCPASHDVPVHDISEVLEHNQNWGNYQVFHYWDKPAEGYYCLSENDVLLKKHAEQIRDLGIDFVFVDVTNHAYVDGRSDRAIEMIIAPFDRMIDIWSKVEGAPRIVPWVPLRESDTNPDVNMVDALLQRLGAYPGLQFEYQGKPLILVTDNDWLPVNETKFQQLQANYTLRKMWGAYTESGSNWSFMQRCEESPMNNIPCFQRSAELSGNIEQVTIAMAYQATYMTNTATATPKHHGKTFRKQFETLLNNPEVPIATITGWNEWIAQRQECDTVPMCDCATFPDGCFLDAWDIEYNRDIEPGVNEMGDYYYRLVKSCIELFRRGDRCDDANSEELCCADWNG